MTAPDRIFVDPDALPSGWDKLYDADVEYVRADLAHTTLEEISRPPKECSMTDLNPYEEGLALELQEAKIRIKALQKALKDQSSVSDRLSEKLYKAEAERDAANALLREARSDLEVYITNEYPKDQHPYYERQWNRDMELCRRIDAHLGAKP